MDFKNVLINMLLGVITSIVIMKDNSKLYNCHKIDKRKILKFILLFLFNSIIFTLYNLFNNKVIIGFYLIILIESLISHNYKWSIAYLSNGLSYLIFTIIELVLFFIKKISVPFYTYNLYVNNDNIIISRIFIFLISYIISDILINKYKYIIIKIFNNIKNSRQIFILLSICLSLDIIIKIYLYENLIDNEGLIYIILLCLFIMYINLFKLRDLYSIAILEEKNMLLETNHLMQKKYYEIYKNRYKKYKVFKHDIKNYLLSIKILFTRKDYNSIEKYIENLEGKLSNINKIYYTNNLVIDSILHNIEEICKVKSIKLVFEGSIDNSNKIIDLADLLMKTMYICINLIENGDYEKKIECQLKSVERQYCFYIKLSTFTNEYNELESKIVNELYQKAKELKAIINYNKENYKFAIKCML